MSNVLIIGNGFDLDLGLDTSYKSFWEWYKRCVKRPDNALFRFIDKKSEKEKWLDLESQLQEFFTHKIGNDFEHKDIESYILEYESIKRSLNEYIRNEQDSKNMREESTAYRLIQRINETKNYFDIYTFNYTDLYELGLNKEIPYHHVHGDFGGIVLGIYDDVAIPKGCSKVYKTFDKNFNPRGIHTMINGSKNIVLYGHSIVGTDYPYFQRVLEKMSNLDEKSDNVKMTIFTKDEKSRMDMFDGLKSRGIVIGNLKLNNSVEEFLTESIDEEAFQAFLSGIVHLQTNLQ